MYVEKHGKPPSKRTVWLLGQQAAQNTRRTKAEARRTVAGQAGAAEPTKAQRLAAWEAQTARREVQALSALHEEVARFAALRPRRAPAVLDDAAKRRAAHIVTGQTAPPDHPPYQQASPESVVKAILERDDADLSATEQIRHAQDWAGGTGHLLTLWSAAVRHSLCPQIDQQIKARLTEAEGWRYDREHSRPVLQQRLRTAQLAGHDIGAIIAQITAAPMDRARSISSVLHARLQQLQLPDLGHNVTWAQRTPKDAPAVAHQLAAGLDQRARALGEQLAASPEPWLAGRLGVLAPHASPLLREDYARRAAAATAYREAVGITDPGPAIAPEPHRGNPELDHLRQAAIRALEIRDETEILRRMSHGELEARILDGTAPWPAPHPTSPCNCCSPPRPRPTLGSNPPTPRSSRTRPGWRARRRSPGI